MGGGLTLLIICVFFLFKGNVTDMIGVHEALLITHNEVPGDIW